MNSTMAFQSTNYHYTDWSNILTKLYRKNNTEGVSALSNHGYIVIPESLKKSSALHVITPHENYSIENATLQFVQHSFMEDCGLCIANIIETNQHHMTGETINSDYILLCRNLCEMVIHQTENILQYTTEHLRNREAEGQKILKYESVKLTIAEAVCEIESAYALLDVAYQVDALFQVVSNVLNALDLLVKLGGGRVMLRGNACELIYHLYIFQSIYLQL